MTKLKKKKKAQGDGQIINLRTQQQKQTFLCPLIRFSDLFKVF